MGGGIGGGGLPILPPTAAVVLAPATAIAAMARLGLTHPPAGAPKGQDARGAAFTQLSSGSRCRDVRRSRSHAPLWIPLPDPSPCP